MTGERNGDDGPVGATVGLSVGPVGGALDGTRLAFRVALGAGRGADDDRDATTIEVETPSAATDGDGDTDEESAE